MIDYLSVQGGKVLFGKTGTLVSGKEINTGWRGAFRPVTVNGRSNQLSGFCGWPCEGSGGNGRKVPQTKDYPVSHGKAQKEENNGWTNIRGTYSDGMPHAKFRRQTKLRGTARTNVFRLSCPALRFPSGM